jgi:hypothetical protein
MPLLLATCPPLPRRDVEPTTSDPSPSLSSIYTPPRLAVICLVHSFVDLALAAGKLFEAGEGREVDWSRIGSGTAMPPNGQDVHGRNGAAVSVPAPSNKMDCFLTAVCTPLNLQVGTAAARRRWI